MPRRRLILASILTATSAFIAPACSDDDHEHDDSDAGTDAGAGGSSSGTGGGSGTGGRAATGGMSGTGGASATGGTSSNPDAGLDASSDGSSMEDASDDGSEPDGASFPDAGMDGAADGSASFSGLLLVAGTDYSTATEITAIDLATRTVTASTTVPDGDAVVTASSGRGVIIERTLGRFSTLTETGEQDRVIDLEVDDGGPTFLNPHDVVVVPGESGPDRAFVSLYGANRIDIFDLSTGAREKSIDLSGFLLSGDADGSVDVDRGVYVPETGKVYFGLQRINLFEFPIPCPSEPSVIVVLDARTGELASEDGGTGVIELDVVSPSTIDLDGAGERLIVTGNGCFESQDGGAAVRVRHGIEIVPLDGTPPTVAYASTNQDYISGTLLLDANRGIVLAFDADAFFGKANLWTIGAPTLGESLANVPSGVVVFDADRLFGIEHADVDGGRVANVVTYSVTAQSTEVFYPSPWAQYSTFVSGSAIVR